MTNYRHAQMIHIIDRMDSPILGVQASRCMLVRNRNANCLRCADVCTTKAISVNAQGVFVDPQRCIGCGTCASACPTGCLSARNPADETLFGTVERAAAAGEGAVAIACEQACALLGAPCRPGHVAGRLADGTPAVAVVCLGRADESLLVEAVAAGLRDIRLLSGDCKSCAHENGGELCDAICSSARSLLEAFGAQFPVRKIAVPDDAEPLALDESHLPPAPQPKAEPAADDDKGSPAKRCGQKVAYRTALVPGARKDFEPEFPHVQADGTLAHFVPERRLRLFNSLKALGTPCRESVSTRLWGQVSIDTELCRSCRMCTVFCPTGALARFDTETGTFGVEHRSTLCTQCRMCETICPEKAVTVSDTVSLDEFLTGRKLSFEMLPLGWNPGKEDAIASRMARFIKADNVQEPQAKVRSGDTAERRAYAQERERRRAEIRQANNRDA